MELKKDYKRENLLINPKFQLTIISYFIAVSFAIIGILYSANEYFFTKFLQMGLDAKLAEDHVYFQFLKDQKAVMINVYLVVAAVVFIITCVAGIIISHRISGSVYRITKHMLGMAEGKDLTEVTLRKNDFFKELADAHNQFVKYLKAKNIFSKHG
jgi:signal transduction histidine kinase